MNAKKTESAPKESAADRIAREEREKAEAKAREDAISGAADSKEDADKREKEAHEAELARMEAEETEKMKAAMAELGEANDKIAKLEAQIGASSKRGGSSLNETQQAALEKMLRIVVDIPKDAPNEHRLFARAAGRLEWTVGDARDLVGMSQETS